MFFFLSRYMQEVLRYDALKTGLSYLPLALVIIVSAGAASVLVTKLGFKPVLIAGLVLITIGLLWFTQLPVDGVYLSDIIAPMIISAAGLGFAFVPVTIAAVSGISKDDSGLASGSSTRRSRSAARSAWRCSRRSPTRRRRISSRRRRARPPRCPTP